MKKFFVILVAVLAYVVADAQPPMGGGPGGGPGMGANRNARMVEMLQKQLGMTAEQAKKFAPVYQGYMREIRQVRKDTKMIVDSYKDEEMTVKVAKKIMVAQLNGDKQIIQVKKEYIQVFVNHLTPEQLAKVFTLGQPRRPRNPQGGPNAPQGGPNAPQGGPNAPQGGPNAPQGGR